MIRPQRLTAGDTIGIVATGKKIIREDIENAISIFDSWGLKIKLASHLLSGEHSYLAATDAHRLADIQNMIDDPMVKAIACARGGYGTTRILDQIDLSGMKSYPKWIVGFSDVTALHLKLFHSGIESIHGTMPILFSHSDSLGSIASLKEALFSMATTITTEAHQSNRKGSAQGVVIGGNLSLLNDSLGTSTQPSTDGCILIIEEIEEYHYKVDRMLTQLKRAGLLSGLSGLVVGHMTNMQDTTPGFGESIHEIILDKVENYGYPVAFGFPTGHENPNLAWIHGSTMSLSVDDAFTELKPVTPA